MTRVGTGPAVRATGVQRRFPIAASKRTVQAIADLSIDVPRGSLTAIVGPDGAGKTTFLRMIAGLLRADAGVLQVLGIDVARDPQAVQDRISYMPQRFGLYEDLSVQENLDLYADLHGVRDDVRRERYARLMRMTDLGDFTGRLAGKLSGGMKQKLGLACTLVRSPELLLLDEPTVGVDPLSRRELWQIVEQLVGDEHLTVIVSTLYLDEAERSAQVLLMREGRLLLDGPPAQVRDEATGLCSVATPGAGEPARTLQARLLDDSPHVVDAVPHAGEVRFIRTRETLREPLPEAVRDRAVRPVPPRLEDGFMALLHRTGARRADAPASGVAAHPPPAATGDQGEPPVIEVRNLTRRFGAFVAVADTTFSVARGEVFGLLGPNGAGKTTTFRMLCGLLPPSSGTLRVAGVDMRHARASARRRIGYVAQKFALYANLTVAANLRFFAGAYGLPRERLAARVEAVMREFELDAFSATPSGLLPGGYRQRLAMAAALLHEPEILFLDEPTSGADPLARREFWRRITALAAARTTIVVTTHFMEEAEYCDRVLIQDAGKVLALGTPAALRAQVAQGASGAADPPDGPLDMEQAFIGIVRAARAREAAAPQAGAR